MQVNTYKAILMKTGGIQETCNTPISIAIIREAFKDNKYQKSNKAKKSKTIETIFTTRIHSSKKLSWSSFKAINLWIRIRNLIKKKQRTEHPSDTQTKFICNNIKRSIRLLKTPKPIAKASTEVLRSRIPRIKA